MRHKPFRALARLAGGAALAAVCLHSAAAQQQPYVPLPQSVIVFPFDTPDGVNQSVGDTVTNGIRSRMSHVTGFEATTFNSKSPLIRRAVSAGELTQTQLAGPFDAATAAAVALAAGVDNALVGSVESATNADGTAKVSISVQLVSSRDAAVQKTAGVTGTATTQAGLAPDAQLRAAADDAAAKAVAQVFGSSANVGDVPIIGAPNQTVTPAPAAGPAGAAPATNSQLNIPTAPTRLPVGSIPVESKRKKRSSVGLIIGGLALLGLIIAASGNGGGGGGGGGNDGGGPPTFPL